MATLRWKFPELLDEYNITAYRVAKKIGAVERVATIYRLANQESRPSRADFKTIADIISALKEITGKDIQLNDLLEYIPDTTDDNLD